MKIKRFILIWLLLCIYLILTFAQEKTDIFISSFPYGAKVVINGRSLPEKTPVLIRNLDAGVYTINLQLNGYETSVQDLSLGEEHIVHHSVTLQPLFLQIPIQATNISVNNSPVKTGPAGFMIPQGKWDMSYDGNRISLNPVYPYQQQYTISKTATIIFAALSTLMFSYDLITPVEKSSLVSPFTWACAGSGFAAGAFWTGYTLNRRSYLKSVTSLPMNTYEHAGLGKDLYQKAEQQLAEGDIHGALDIYSQLIHSYSASAYLPAALYKTGKINEILGNLNIAAELYSLLVKKYPLPEFYDKSCYSLAIIREQQKDYKQSIEYLYKMVFYDPGYSVEEIQQKIEELSQLEAEL